MRHSNGTYFGIFPVPVIPVPLNKPGHAVLSAVLIAFLTPLSSSFPSFPGCVEVGNSRSTIALRAISATASCAFFLLPTGAHSKIPVEASSLPHAAASLAAADGTGFSTTFTVDTKTGGTGGGSTAWVSYSGSANLCC